MPDRESALWESEERARREDPTLLINIFDDKPRKPAMTKAEARRRVAHGAAMLLDNGSENVWLSQGDGDDALPPEDAAVMEEAFDELVSELLRRGVKRQRKGKGRNRP